MGEVSLCVGSTRGQARLCRVGQMLCLWAPAGAFGSRLLGLGRRWARPECFTVDLGVEAV